MKIRKHLLRGFLLVMILAPVLAFLGLQTGPGKHLLADVLTLRSGEEHDLDDLLDDLAAAGDLVLELDPPDLAGVLARGQ